MKSEKAIGESCKPQARAYLECRMLKGLMAKEEMRDLGFFDEEDGTKKARPSWQWKGNFLPHHLASTRESEPVIWNMYEVALWASDD